MKPKRTRPDIMSFTLPATIRQQLYQQAAKTKQSMSLIVQKALQRAFQRRRRGKK